MQRRIWTSDYAPESRERTKRNEKCFCLIMDERKQRTRIHCAIGRRRRRQSPVSNMDDGCWLAGYCIFHRTRFVLARP